MTGRVPILRLNQKHACGGSGTTRFAYARTRGGSSMTCSALRASVSVASCRRFERINSLPLSLPTETPCCIHPFSILASQAIEKHPSIACMQSFSITSRASTTFDGEGLTMSWVMSRSCFSLCQTVPTVLSSGWIGLKAALLLSTSIALSRGMPRVYASLRCFLSLLDVLVPSS